MKPKKVTKLFEMFRLSLRKQGPTQMTQDNNQNTKLLKNVFTST